MTPNKKSFATGCNFKFFAYPDGMNKSHFVKIKRLNEDQQIAYGEVYAPFVLDTYGEMMLPADIELMAHRFMELSHVAAAIDTNHDNQSNGSFPIESFIARTGDPDFAEGAWVLGVKVVDEAVWDLMKRGVLNGYSFEAMVRKLPAVVELEVTRDNVGETEEANGHTHLFFAELGDDGVVKEGRTDTVSGHDHLIIAGTATEPAHNHAHRFFI